MPKYKASKNITVKEGDKPQKHVKKGESFDVSAEYHEEHLAPHGHTEESAKKAPKEDAKDDKKEEKKEHKK